MPATPLPTSTPIGKGDWLDLPEAARRSGRSVGQLRRRCGDDWRAKGLARQTRRGKGKASWEIHETADAGFARVKLADAIGTDLRHLTGRQRETALFRRDILTAWSDSVTAAFQLGFDRDAGTGRFLEQLFLGQVASVPGSHEISRRTLYNWQSRYQAGGLSGLADGRGNQAVARRTEQVDDPFFSYVRQLYLTQRRLKLAACVTYATLRADEEGWAVHNYKACQRMIAAIPKPELIRLREGPKAAKNKVDAYIVRDYASLESNEVWCADHHRLDVICAVPDGKGGTKHVRPWLSAWQDVRSRFIVGWMIFAHDPNADVILRAFAKGAIAHGVPKIAQVDNGKDYDSRQLQGVTKKQRRQGVDPDRVVGAFRSMQVKVHHVWPYHGQSKPIERFFGSVADRFARMFDTYTGGTTTTRPEDLTKQLKGGKAPTVVEVERAFGEWLLVDHQLRPHLGDGMEGRRPSEVFEACMVTKRTMPESEIWFNCLPRVGPVKYGQAGVTWKGMSWGGFDSGLKNACFEKSVYIAIDRDNVSRVFVLDLQGRFLGEAHANRTLGFNATEHDVRQAIAAKKAATRAAKTYREHRPRIGADVQQLVADAAASRVLKQQRQRPDPDQPPPSLQPVQTPFNQDLQAIRSAYEGPRKQAVGAESVPLPERFEYRDSFTPAAEDDELPPISDYLAFRARHQQEGSNE